MSRRPLLIALSLALAVAPLAACADSTQIPPAGPSASADPLFATDEEALAAATAAYEEYLLASGGASAEPGAFPNALVELTTEDYLAEVVASLEQLETSKLRIVGESSLVSTELQQYFEDDSRSARVVIYACLDVSGARAIDETGNDQTSEDRDQLVDLEVTMVSDDQFPTRLLVAGSASWPDKAACK